MATDLLFSSGSFQGYLLPHLVRITIQKLRKNNNLVFFSKESSETFPSSPIYLHSLALNVLLGPQYTHT